MKTAQHHFAYNASKAAVIHLTKMLGFEIGNNGLKVRVNSIAPGVFPSEMTQGESGENQKSELPKEDFEGKVFAQRPGNDRDMANMMITVATNQYLNGQAIAVCQLVILLLLNLRNYANRSFAIGGRRLHLAARLCIESETRVIKAYDYLS